MITDERDDGDISKYCDELILLIRNLRVLGGDPRQVFNRPLVLFELDHAATARADDGLPRYKAADCYAEVCAALRLLALQRQEQSAGEREGGAA